MIDGSKLYSDVMIKHFKKELAMTQEDDEDFETLLNVGFLVLIIFMVMLK